MNPIYQTSIRRVGIVLNIHEINHINQIGPTLNHHFPTWGFDKKNEDSQSTLEKSIEIMQQCILQNNQLNQKLIETNAYRDMHFNKITSYLNQPALIPISDLTKEFH